MDVSIPLETRSFRTSLSVPYQLKLGVLYPIRGRWTVAKEARKNAFDSWFLGFGLPNHWLWSKAPIWVVTHLLRVAWHTHETSQNGNPEQLRNMQRSWGETAWTPPKKWVWGPLYKTLTLCKATSTCERSVLLLSTRSKTNSIKGIFNNPRLCWRGNYFIQHWHERINNIAVYTQRLAWKRTRLWFHFPLFLPVFSLTISRWGNSDHITMIEL